MRIIVALVVAGFVAGCLGTPTPAPPNDANVQRDSTDTFLGYYYEPLEHDRNVIAFEDPPTFYPYENEPPEGNSGEPVTVTWTDYPYNTQNPERFTVILHFEGAGAPQSVLVTLHISGATSGDESETILFEEEWWDGDSHSVEFDRDRAFNLEITSEYSSPFNMTVVYIWDEKVGKRCRTYQDNGETICWTTDEWGDPRDPPSGAG